MSAPTHSFAPIALPNDVHDDLIDAFINADDAEFWRLHALYYPEGEDDAS